MASSEAWRTFISRPQEWYHNVIDEIVRLSVWPHALSHPAAPPAG
jgi:hypothetical protein